MKARLTDGRFRAPSCPDVFRASMARRLSFQMAIGSRILNPGMAARPACDPHHHSAA